ncbi:MAG: hypothetical protein PHV59_01695 [Victivallales bacterium]|nr:hypothetical protein [Victivallales bacterium]
MNRKISFSTRIKIIVQNYGKPAFYIPFLTIGIIASLAFIRSCGSVAGLVGAVLGLIWGLIIARLAAPAIGNWFGNIFYSPRSCLAVSPDILSPIKGLLARAEYAPAIAKLNTLLAEKPFSPEPYLLLVETYAGELNDYRRAMELTEEYFNRKKVEPVGENIELLLLYADLCEEHDYLEKARLLLEREVARKGYPEIKRKRLQSRLEAIIETLVTSN